MARPVTLFTGQWADLSLEEVARRASDWGYDGLELACWGDHFDPAKGARSADYCDEKRSLLDKYGLKCWAISHHLAGQLVLDNIDKRHMGFVPPKIKHTKEAREWAVKTMMSCAGAARNMGVEVVNGFTGSSIWHLIYSFPPVEEAQIQAG